jgi:formamidopyrimidine-DNA glycosylase
LLGHIGTLRGVPEQPEMQALAERLTDVLAGAEIASLTAIQFSALKTFAPAPEELRGRRIERVGRRGKFLVIDVGGDGTRVLVHLSQGGRVTIEKPPKSTRPKGGVVRITTADPDRPSVLVHEYGTERKAAWWVLGPGDDGPLTTLGPEPLSDEFATFVRTGTDGRRVHTILRDQHTVAGMGRGYTDDALHRAKLSPYASLKSLSADERERLLTAIADVLADGLEHERARKGGLPPKVGDHWVVHGRYGQTCPTCGDDLRRVSYEAYEVTYCPTCQNDGKVLADRRMSRLIR